MAQVPDIDGTTREIFDAIASYNVRAGEVVRLMGVQMKLQHLRADDLNAALDDMNDKGYIEAARAGFIKLTDEGFAAMGASTGVLPPAVEEVTRAIFDAIGSYNVRAGETVPLMGVQMKLQHIRTDDFNAALDDMGDKGYIEAGRAGFIKLTEAGFAEL